MTTRDTILSWLRKAQVGGHSHVIVVCDEFDHEDFPVFCKDREEALKQRAHYDNLKMHRIMEIYDLSLSLDSQMAEHRAMHL